MPELLNIEKSVGRKPGGSGRQPADVSMGKFQNSSLVRLPVLPFVRSFVAPLELGKLQDAASQVGPESDMGLMSFLSF